MKFDPEIACNLCGSRAYGRLYGKEYKGDIYQLVKCVNCGLAYINPQPSDEGLKHFYDFVLNSREWLSQFPESVDTNYYESRTVAGLYGYRTYLKTVERFIKGGNLLDVGCGDGPLFKIADGTIWKMFGLDISQKAFNYHKENPAVNFYYGTIESSPYEESFFDAVFSFDTIEHVKDPLSFLRAIAKVMKTGGVLCINTVNIDSPEAKRERERWVQFTPPGHLCYFSPRTIRRYLEKAGFRVIKFDMRIPFFPLAEHRFATEGTGTSDDELAATTLHRFPVAFVKRTLRPFKPVLAPLYNLLCHVKGRIVGKPNIVVYARKVRAIQP